MNEFNFNITDNNITTIVENAIIHNKSNEEIVYILDHFLKYKHCYEKTPAYLMKIVFTFLFGEYAAKAINNYYINYENDKKVIRKLTLLEFKFVLSKYIIDETEKYKKYVGLLGDYVECNEYLKLLKDCCELLNIDFDYIVDDVEVYRIESYLDENG